MLETTTYHTLVPKEPLANLSYRQRLLAECRSSSQARRLTWKACQADPVFFIDSFGWQTNPEQIDEEDGPFICFPFQEEAIFNTVQWLIRERQLVIWEKSRKQGGTYLALFLDVWLTLFHRRKRSLVMSHKESAVERSGDEDTLFGKIDFILNHLPSWMQDGLPRVKGVYRFKVTKSQIVSTSTTAKSGVGGRTSKNTLDEFSKYDKAKDILGQMRDTGPSLIIGTHYGIGGEFFDLCNRSDIYKVVMHWSKNPMYHQGLYRSDPGLRPHERIVLAGSPPPPDYPFITDGSPKGGPFPGIRSPYYDSICRDRSSREVAIHWDIDPAGASHHKYDINLIRLLIARYCRDPEWRGEIAHDPEGRVQFLKEHESGKLRMWTNPLYDGESTNRWISPSMYKVGADIGAGTGATPSCLSVADAVTGQKVAEYQHAFVTPERFGVLAVAICNLFRDPTGMPAKLIWDAGGPTGDKFGKEVLARGFRNVWYWRDEFTLNQKISDSPGWFPTPSSILSLHDDYEDGLRRGLFVNRSENALKECLAFEYTKTGGIAHGHSVRTEDPSAGRVNHSDQAVADALCFKLCKDAGAGKKPEDRPDYTGYPVMSYGWLLQRDDQERSLDPFRR